MRRDPSAHALPLYLRPLFLAGLVALLTGLKLWSAANAHFVEDEAYYRLWGLFPAPGYLDHPPMIAWWIWLGQQMFGDTVLSVRLMVVLSSVLGSAFLWRTAFVLFDARTAGWSVLFLNASILVGVGGILATPDAPSVFFWGLSLWALAELVHSKNPTWWLAVGLFAGLGLVSKYSVLFLGAGIVLWLLWVPEARRWFGAWQLWAGGLIAVACVSPVLYWNHLYDWASFAKQFGRAGGGAWTTKYVFEFFGSVLGLMNPLLTLPALVGGVVLGRRALSRQAGPALLVLTVLPFLVYLTYHSLHARVQANWPAPLFPTFALMAAVVVADLTRSVFWKRLGVVGVALGIAIAVLVQIHAVYPLTGSLARKDPTFQLRGWPELGFKLRRIAVDTGAAYVLTGGYGLNGQLDYLLKDDLSVVQFNERLRYVMAPDPDPELFAGTGLYVAEARRDRSAVLRERYDSVVLLATLPRQVLGVTLEDIVVYELIGRKAGPLDPLVTGTGDE